MRTTNQSFSNKVEKYIYTEADLGEGLLDAGVTYPFQLNKIKNKTNLKVHTNYKPLQIINNFYNSGVPHVQDDLSFTYYY